MKQYRQRYSQVIWAGFLSFFLLLGGALPLQAEVYKWQDAQGTIHYSNKPPDNPARMLESSPTQEYQPATQPATQYNGYLYYLNVPTGTVSAAQDPMTLTPEVVQALLQEPPQPYEQVAMLEAKVNDTSSLMVELLKKNRFMEELITRQAQALKLQEEQLKAVETQLAQLQASAQAQPLVVSDAQAVQEPGVSVEKPKSGIAIVPRQERRNSSYKGIVGWFKKRIGR